MFFFWKEVKTKKINHLYEKMSRRKSKYAKIDGGKLSCSLKSTAHELNEEDVHGSVVDKDLHVEEFGLNL